MAQTVRCKFRCNEVVKRLGWQKDNPFIYSAKFSAVTDDSPENKNFFAATPSGQLEVSTMKEDLFEIGKSYYLDITLAE